MEWVEIEILTTVEAVEAVHLILERLGVTGIIVEDSNDLKTVPGDRYGEMYDLNPANYPGTGVRVRAYLPGESWREETAGQIETDVKNLVQAGLEPGPTAVKYRYVSDEDWIDWKKYYHVVRISPNLIIKPVWEDYLPQSSEIVIELEPGLAFGTGTHATTAICLKLLERVVKPGDRVIDVGCGTGILSIACAKMGACEVLALDLDPMAVKAAEKNIKLNGVNNIITVYNNDLLSGIKGRYDVIVANILAEIIVRMSGDVKKVLKPRGKFIASGIPENKMTFMKNEIVKKGFVIETTVTEDGWIGLVAGFA